MNSFAKSETHEKKKNEEPFLALYESSFLPVAHLISLNLRTVD